MPFPAAAPSCKLTPRPRSKHEKLTAGSAWETWTVVAANGVRFARVRWEINFLLTFETTPFICKHTVYPSQHFPFGAAFVCQAVNFWTLLCMSKNSKNVCVCACRSDVEETLHKYTGILLSMYLYGITDLQIYLTITKCVGVSVLLTSYWTSLQIIYKPCTN